MAAKGAWNSAFRRFSLRVCVISNSQYCETDLKASCGCASLQEKEWVVMAANGISAGCHVCTTWSFLQGEIFHPVLALLPVILPKVHSVSVQHSWSWRHNWPWVFLLFSAQCRDRYCTSVPEGTGEHTCPLSTFRIKLTHFILTLFVLKR